MKEAALGLIAAGSLLLASLAAPVSAAEAESETSPFLLHRTALAAEARGEAASAVDIFSQACLAGLASSCTMAGLARLEQSDETDALMEAAQQLAVGCLAGSDFACTKMGFALGRVSAQLRGNEGFVAIAMLQMGEECRARPNDGACHDAAALLRAEDRGGADMDAVHAYAARACANERRPGCLPVAAPPPTTESGAYDRASAYCRSARADGCIALLDLLLKDADRPAIPLARQALEEACDGRIGIACANLGLYYSHGPVAARDEEAARRFMRAGCDGAVAQACFAFAVMHRKGIGGPVNLKRSVELVAHACDLGWAEACEIMAMLVQEADASAVPGRDAAALRQRACRLGRDESCAAVPSPSPRI